MIGAVGVVVDAAGFQARRETQGHEGVVDAEAAFGQLTLNTVRQIEQLAPFGAGNPRPVLCASQVTLAAPPKRMGGDVVLTGWNRECSRELSRKLAG